MKRPFWAAIGLSLTVPAIQQTDVSVTAQPEKTAGVLQRIGTARIHVNTLGKIAIADAAGSGFRLSLGDCDLEHRPVDTTCNLYAEWLGESPISVELTH